MSRYVMELMVRDVNFSKELAKAQAMLQQTTAVSMALTTAMNAMRVGTMAGALSMAALVAPTLLAVRALSDFDASLRRIAAIGGPEFRGNLAGISKEITNLAIKYGVASEDIAAGMVEFTKAGFDMKTITEELIEGAAQLAIVNQESFQTVAQVVTYAQSLWGDSVENAYELMEKMHTAANLSILDVNDLASAFEYVGSSMVIAGVSFNEFLATMASLSNIAYTSSENVGTLINRILVNGSKLESILGLAPGTVISEGVVNVKGLMEVLAGLGSRWEITAEIAELWGVRSVKAFNSLMVTAGGENGMLAILEVLEGDTTNLAEAADFMTSSFDNLIISLKETFMSALRNEDVMTALRNALLSVSAAFSSDDFQKAISDFVIFSANFVTGEGPGLVRTLMEILKTVVSLAPEIKEMAMLFKSLINFISRLDSTTLMLFATFFMARSIFPTQQMLAYGMAIRGARDATLAFGIAQATTNMQLSATSRIMPSYGAAQSAWTYGSVIPGLTANPYAAAQATATAASASAARNLKQADILSYGIPNYSLYGNYGSKYLYNSKGLVSGGSQMSLTGVPGGMYGSANPAAMRQYSAMMQARQAGTYSTMMPFTGGTQTNIGQWGAMGMMGGGMLPSGIATQNTVWAKGQVPYMGKMTTGFEELTVSNQRLNEMFERSNVLMTTQNKNMENVTLRAYDTGNGILYMQTTQHKLNTATDQFAKSSTIMDAQMIKTGTIGQRYRHGLLKIQSGAAQLAATQLMVQFSSMAMMSGLMVFVTSERPLTKAVGAITAALMGLVMAIGMFHIVTSIGVKLALIAASVVAFVGLMKLQMSEVESMQNDVSGNFNSGMGGGDVFSNVPTYQSFDETEENASAIGGRVLSKGWRYIHPNEYIIPSETVAAVDSRSRSFKDFLDFLGGLSYVPRQTGMSTAGAAPQAAGQSTYYDYKTVHVYDTKQDDLHRVLRSGGLV